MPRTGSMWTFNVLRDLVREAGHPLRPERIPAEDDRMIAIGRQGAVNTSGEVHVLKVHNHLPLDLPNSHYVVTHRDIHDVIMSFTRFTSLDFEAGVQYVEAVLELEQATEKVPPELRTDVEHADIVARPVEVAQRLASVFGLDLPAGTAEAIVSRYTKDAVRARIDQAERRVAAKINAREPITTDDVVVGPTQVMRAFDAGTGFQSGHVSNYRDGDWQTILTVSQQQQLNDRIEAVRRRLAAG